MLTRGAASQHLAQDDGRGILADEVAHQRLGGPLLEDDDGVGARGKDAMNQQNQDSPPGATPTAAVGVR